MRNPSKKIKVEIQAEGEENGTASGQMGGWWGKAPKQLVVSILLSCLQVPREASNDSCFISKLISISKAK
jgi:hypothetical protein